MTGLFKPGMRDAAKRVIREPLVHFLIAGAAVFLLLAGREPDLAERRIVVSEDDVAQLVQRWIRTFRRNPTDEEMQALVGQHVEDQVYYREALRLGLDKDDEVVVRRMRNKIVAMASLPVDAAKPGDAELQSYLDKNPKRYAGDDTYSFEQVWLGENTPANRERARAMADASAHQPGSFDAVANALPVSPIARTHRDQSASDVANTFGGSFATGLANAPPDKWVGPVLSGFGVHLVRLTRRVPAMAPTMDAVRAQVLNDWRSAKVREAEQAQYRKIAQGYRIEIEQPR